MIRNEYIKQIEKVAQDEIENQSALSKLKDSYMDVKINNAKKNMLRTTGAVVGTGIAMKKGMPLGKAVANGGMAGIAVGDIAGATIIPTRDLYKKHIEAFGVAPSIKDTGKVIAANTLPAAAFWGAAYGTKLGIQKRNAIAQKMGDKASDVTTKPKRLAELRDAIVDMIPEDGPRDSNGLVILTPEQKSNISNYSKRGFGNILFGDGAGDAIVEQGGVGLGKLMLKKGKGASKAMIVPTIASSVMDVPAMYVSPRNIVNAKKRKNEQAEK